MKFQTMWSWAVGYIPIKYYSLYFLQFCFISSIFLGYYSCESLSSYWKKCLMGRECSMFWGGVWTVSLGLPYLFLVFLKFIGLDWNKLSTFWGTNLSPASLSIVFLIKLLKTTLDSLLFLLVYSKTYLLILLSLSWIFWFFMKLAFFYLT